VLDEDIPQSKELTKPGPNSFVSGFRNLFR